MGREDAFTKESANVAFFLKQSWGGVGKAVERWVILYEGPMSNVGKEV